MRTSDLDTVFQAGGPFLSIYLATRGDLENAAQQVETRWRSLRRDLADDGVAEETLAAVDPLVPDAHLAGDTLAVIAGPDGVRYRQSLPDPPPSEVIVRHGPLPYLLPLLRWRQTQAPHVVVLTDRTGAEIVARLPEAPDRAQTVEGEQSPHLTRTSAGGWSQLRYQHRAENLWEANAGEVAAALTRLVDEVGPRFVAVAGDVRAVQLLSQEAPDRVRDLLETVGGDWQSIDPLVEQADERVRALAAEDTGALLARFGEERAQQDRAVEGPGLTLEALAKAQVDILLLQEQDVDDRTAWFGPKPVHLAAEPNALAAMGVDHPVEGPLVDVLVRGALGTGARVHLLDGGEPDAPEAGVGALLRWSDELSDR